MEACLEIYGFYRPIMKRTIVGILCVAILTGAVFSRKAVGTKEYLSAENARKNFSRTCVLERASKRRKATSRRNKTLSDKRVYALVRTSGIDKSNFIPAKRSLTV